MMNSRMPKPEDHKESAKGRCPNTRGSERGIILLMTLFIVTLFTILVLEFNYTTRVEYKLAGTVRDELLALSSARAGRLEKIALVRADRLEDIEEKEEENEEMGRAVTPTPTPSAGEEEGALKKWSGVPRDSQYPDYYGEEWGKEIIDEPFGAGFLSVKIIDESGKININTLVKEIKPVAAPATPTPVPSEEGEEAQAVEVEEEPTVAPRAWGQKDPELAGGESSPESEPTPLDQQAARYVVDKKTEKDIMRLVKILDVQGVDEEKVTAAIVDWMDSNDEGEWEDDAYGEEGPPPKNAPLDVISELLLIEGVTGDLYYGPKKPELILLDEEFSRKGKQWEKITGLEDCLTVCSQVKVNVNTAPADVLSSLLDEENESLVKEIVSYTKKDYFKDVNQFEEKMGEHIPAAFKAKIGVGSDSFQIISEGRVNDVRKQLRAYIYRDDDANVRILYWGIDK